MKEVGKIINITPNKFVIKQTQKEENYFLYLKSKISRGSVLWGEKKAHHSFFCCAQIMHKHI
jgi:hypothetical protein